MNISSFIRPEFFDIFGIVVFCFIIVLSVWALKTKRPISKWALIVLFIIGVAGILVDGVMVYTTYLK